MQVLEGCHVCQGKVQFLTDGLALQLLGVHFVCRIRRRRAAQGVKVGSEEMPHKANSGGRKQTRQTDRQTEVGCRTKGCVKRKEIDENTEEQNKIKQINVFFLVFSSF